MELEIFQSLPRDTPEQDPTPAQSEDQSQKRVSACDLKSLESDDLEGLGQKNEEEMDTILEGLGQKNEEEMDTILEEIQEKASSVLEFALKWEEELKELKKKEEEQLMLAKERDKKIEASITERLGESAEKESESDLKLILEANVTRLVLQMQNEQTVLAHLNAQEKLLGLLQSSMMKKNEEVMRELEARKKEVTLLSKSTDEKSSALEMKVKEFDLKQILETDRMRKEAELVETSLKQLEARENELSLLNDTIKEKSTELEKKEEYFQLKQQTESREIEVKRKSLELKEKELEEREKELDLKQRGLEEGSVQAETRKRPRLEFEEHIGDTGSLEQTSEADEGEFEEVVSLNDTDEDCEPLMCVDSEFNDFSKTMQSFKDGQVWALYDGIDSMPRCYGQIKKVHESLSSLHVTWFEPEDEESEAVACGRFEWGDTETIETHLTFSHLVDPIIHERNSIAVIPRKGETWALFRDWSKSWNNPEQHKLPYRYDFVEVVFDIDDCLGVGVAYLGKVDGFVSVYEQAGQHGVMSLMVPSEEMRRFSHRVPSVRMNGKEKEGVPARSFELDPAAIPSSVLKRGGSIRKKVQVTERQSEDCGKTSEEGQDGSQKEFPIILD